MVWFKERILSERGDWSFSVGVRGNGRRLRSDSGYRQLLKDVIAAKPKGGSLGRGGGAELASGSQRRRRKRRLCEKL
ncbi:hypothetical protein HPP92_009126 [Vanilla planifolia]|uniref:Uncharacterized protein n=1 Tax=Vanilla planifolia TaxID=51239 RepID=A0A835V4E7_VANPL|nr:hypothetical protein HPP92_009126 [Vanilla planifolia]